MTHKGEYWHPESVEEIPVDLDYRKAFVVMRDTHGEIVHYALWNVAEYRCCYVLTHPEIESAIVAEPGASLTVTYL
ncbi:MAG: hypothetical protein AAF528_01190 [Cyanobacteria bacterium P01_C01_bin.121]